jgi:2-keto-3-deoxy-L-rhamnonate aldolase RhmA
MSVFAALPVGRPLLGTWIKLPAIESVELMAEAGMDLVVVDLEHSPLSLETAATLTAVARGRGLLPLVRVPDHSPSWIQRSLDLGAAGVVVPHVDSLEEARAAQAAARFEPRGRRGVGPTSRAGAWNLRPVADYLATGSEVAVVAQIESMAGIRSVDAILQARAADALLLGAADLSAALGLEMDDPQVTALMLGVLDTCLAADVPCAIAIGADGARAAELGRRGFRIVLAGNDATMLGTAARAVRTATDEEPTRA